MTRSILAVGLALVALVGIGQPANAATGHQHYRVLAGKHSPLLPDAHRCKVPVGAYADDQWCLNRPAWRHVGSGLADALAEGSAPRATTRNWERCYRNRLPGVGIVIACPMGYVELI